MLIDAMILCNQKLIGKEYLKNNFEPGRDIEEAIVPSRMGYTVQSKRCCRTKKERRES